jgi:hypothetical protein
MGWDNRRRDLERIHLRASRLRRDGQDESTYALRDSGVTGRMVRLRASRLRRDRQDGPPTRLATPAGQAG